MKISLSALRNEELSYIPIQPPSLPPGVIPLNDANKIAMDDALAPIYTYANLAYSGQGFVGYQVLAELMQISEYRAPTETIADEMVRKWIELQSTSDDDISEKIKLLEEAMVRYKVRDVFRAAALYDSGYGVAHMFIDIRGQDQEKPLIIDKRTIGLGSLVRLKCVDPMWCAPYNYNSIDPTQPDFYVPTSWYLLGKQTSSTRMLTMISRPVPDMLKPAYNMGGISLTQLLIPAVKNWLRTRDSISDMIHSFSVSGILTDLQSTLSGGDGQDLFNRIKLFTQTKDNRGMMALDKETEEFFQFNIPLSGLDVLQQQAAEQMAMPCHTPLIKLMGISPSGMNATGEDEIAVFYDFIRSRQENLFRDPLQKIINIIQLSEFGEIDPSITFEFMNLDEPSEVEAATIRAQEANSAINYINAGVLSPEEERERLANTNNSGYQNIDVSVLPELDSMQDITGMNNETEEPAANNEPDKA